ncbi:glycoside hydrolase family 19 protein [Myxococcus sp. RHSTA-1-4]|uniref:glycoside hydrolase family 19 protein n=1 Tax=Myxococcus sp. RHSTA-1-4 TaxID=2874601 RepID=UPI001CBCD4C2|nr:glycoside hydrolase family 19 protein [Myxococcus sp. RHSTA-1-4]MBZ4417871.1 peptidoglycan-binding protein [Myxococcus sp. RHSTA-1-4]
MSGVSGSGSSGGADSAGRAEAARAEAARAEAARQAEASRKAAEEAAKAQAAQQAQVAQNPFAADTFTAAAAKAPVDINPSPVSATAQQQTVDAAQEAEATKTAEAEATQEAEAASEAEAAAEATAETDAAAQAQAAQQVQGPVVTESAVTDALNELPAAGLSRNLAGTQPTAQQQALNTQLQTALQELGYVAPSHVTGFYGSITEGALKSFQYETGMQVTGNYDAMTREALAGALAEKRAAEAQGISPRAADLPDTYTPVTDAQLADIMPHASPALRERYLDPLNRAMEEFNISTPARQAAFLSQVAAETGELQFMSEIQPNPAHGAYYGRGALQLTHASNYQEAGRALGVDIARNPNQVATDPDLAARTAGWYFNDRGLNTQADQGRIGAVTLGINGGYNGIDHRLEAYDTARRVLGGE